MLEERAQAFSEGNVGVMAASTGLNVAAILLWVSVLSLIMRDLGASDLQISWCVALWNVANALVQYEGGRLSDRLGRVPLIVWSTYLSAAGIIAAAFMPSWLLFALLYTVWNAANAVGGPAFATIVGESVPPERRGWAYGVMEFVASLGIIIGPLAGARLLPIVEAKGLFIITGLVFLSTACFRQFKLKETRPAGSQETSFTFSQVFQRSLRPVLVVSVAFQLLMLLTLWGPFMALYSSDVMGLTKAQINVYFGVAFAASALCSLLAGKAVDRFGHKRVLAWSVAALTGATLLWTAQRGVTGIGVGFILIASASQLAAVSFQTYRMSVIDPGIRTRAVGAVGALSSLSAALAVPVAGWLKAATPGAPFYLVILVAVVTIVALSGPGLRQMAAPTAAPGGGAAG